MRSVQYLDLPTLIDLPHYKSLSRPVYLSKGSRVATGHRIMFGTHEWFVKF